MAKILGIINLTEDSFYAPSRTPFEKVADRAGELLAEGADVIDLGAFSSRPGASLPSAHEQWVRLEPAIRAIRARYPDAALSVDTFSGEVVRRVFDLAGPFIVNDISAGQWDPDMLPATGSLGLTYIAMHMRGTPLTMQSLTGYTDIVKEVKDYFVEFGEKALREGIRDWILDPGFGFAKTLQQNYTLLQGLPQLCELGRPVLVGVSRKSMIYKLLGIGPEDALMPTQLVHMRALELGAEYLRVHDVAQARMTEKLYSAMYKSSPGEVNL